MRILNRFENPLRLAFLLFFFLCACFSVYLTSRLTASDENYQAEQIAAEIEKAALLAYSLEGSYPADTDYLNKKYGVFLDKENYVFSYEPSNADGAPPVISVTPRGIR